MRGYYAFYGKNLYELKEPARAGKLRGVIPNHLEKKSWNDDGSVELGIHLSNLTVDADSNKETYESALEFIADNELTGLEELSNECAMYLHFSVINNNSDSVVDSGILVKTFALNGGLFPLGITDDNEYLTRYITNSGNICFERTYRDDSPFGLRIKTKKDYTVRIERIQVAQFKVASFSEVPVDESSGRRGRRDIDPMNRPQRYMGTKKKPMFEYTVEDPFISNKHAVIIYDTETEGIMFDPINIKSKLSRIRIVVDIDLNDYFVTGDKNDIEYALKENVNAGSEGEDSGNTDDDPPVIINPPTDDVGEEGNGGHGSESGSEEPSETPSESENGSNSGSSSESGSSESGSESESTSPDSSESGSEENPGSETPTDPDSESGDKTDTSESESATTPDASESVSPNESSSESNSEETPGSESETSA